MLDDLPPQKLISDDLQPLSLREKSSQNTDTLLSASEHARSLCKFGLSERSLSELCQLPTQIQNWSRRVQSLERYPAFQRLYANSATPRLKNIEWLASFSERPLQEPSGFSLYAQILHASPGINKAYRKSKKRALKLEKNLAALDHYLDLEELPSEPATLEALQVVTGRTKTLPFSPRKRQALAIIKQALFEGEKLNNNAVKAYLAELCDIYQDRVRFSERPSLIRLLGPGFRGVNTNWSELKQYIRYSQAIRFASTDQNQTLDLIEHWDERREDFLLASRKAASIRTELDKLARLNSSFLNASDTDNPDLKTIMHHADIAESEIRQHMDFLSSEVDDNTLTPKSIVEMHIA